MSYYNELMKYIGWVKTVDISSLCDMIRDSSIVMTAGNGGSSANASHIACELQKSIGVCAISLVDSIPLITAWSNDYDYTDALVGQYMPLRAHPFSGNLLMIYSGSGESKNLIKLLEVAIKDGSKVIAMTGKIHNTIDAMCRDYGKLSLCVDIDNDYSTQIAEDLHAILNHEIYLRLRSE